jgi:heme-degrading monooxygenase HmoA
MSYVIIWTYDVPPDAADNFIAAYGAHGDWAQLFTKGDGFIGVELYRDGHTFVSIDRWLSEDAFNAFQAAFGDQYKALDAKLAHLSRSQTRIGAFKAP